MKKEILKWNIHDIINDSDVYDEVSEKKEEAILALLSQYEKERDEELVKSVKGYMNNSDVRASDYQVSEDGYVTGLEDALKLIQKGQKK